MTVRSPRQAFKALSSHVESIATAVTDTYGEPGRSMTEGIVAAIDGLDVDEFVPPADRHEEIERRLTLSWAIESQMRMRGRLDPELLAHVLHGVGPEGYYAVFHAARAYVLATTQTVGKDGHRETLNLLARRAVAGALPWPFSATVTGGLQREKFAWTGADGLPPGLRTALTTTREQLLADRVRNWKAKPGRPSTISREGSRLIVSEAAHTTVFDIFLRHRERSNYRDAVVFLDAGADVQEAERYLTSFCVAVESAVTLLNSLTARQLGLPLLQRAAGSFTREGRAELHDAVATRIAVLAERH